MTPLFVKSSALHVRFIEMQQPYRALAFHKPLFCYISLTHGYKLDVANSWWLYKFPKSLAEFL